jgi:hypothetical protein
LAEWLYEAGIGEVRAVLVEEGEIVELRIEPEGGGPRAGAVLPARLLRRADATGRGLVQLEGAGEALIDRVPAGLAEGGSLLVELLREPIPERGRLKPARVRAAEEGSLPAEGPTLLDRIHASGHPVTRLQPHEPDRLEALGWSERLEEAITGDFVLPWGALLMALTPAMTLFDVDGTVERAELAKLGAAEAGRVVRRLDVGGSIGIDLPTLESRAARQVAAAALDAVLPQPFERTAVNGFGFLQIVRRRVRPSIPELLAADPVAAAVRALLRRAERAGGSGTRTLVAHPRLIARLEAEPAWLERLAASIGAGIVLRADPALAISATHVQAEHS